MLGSLARKLRIFGFDTLYFAEGDDDLLEALARRENRVILTSDKALFMQSSRRGVAAFLVEGTTDKARLISVRIQAAPAVSFRIGGRQASRCAVCNGELEVIGRQDLGSATIPARVLSRHRLFYRCTSCSRFFWHGRHWERLRRLSYSLKQRI